MKNRTPTKLPVPDFTPVSRKKPRYDGWTAARQIAFLDALAETGSVKHAAARINMAYEGAYALRRQPDAESFAAAWDAALDHGVQQLAGLAIDRAKEGIEVPVYSYGKLVGTRRVYNDKLLMFCLKHHIGRMGMEDTRPLRAGTRAPQTVARQEAADKERWFEEYKDRLVGDIGELAGQLVAMGEALRYAMQQQQIARERGLFDGEASYIRMANQIFALLAKEPDQWAQKPKALEDIREEMLACREAMSISIFLTPAEDVVHGPTYHQRRLARDDALQTIERGQRMWRASTQEASWAAWRAREEA